MKRHIFPILSSVIAVVLMAGCGAATVSSSAGGSSLSSQSAETPQSLEDANKLNIYTSFYPMYDFAVKVGGDKVNVTNLVPAGTEPHDWEPSTTDLANLEKANLLVYSGAGMEHWVDKVVGSLTNKELITVEASKGIALQEGHHHDEEEADQDEHEEESAYDPHVWISIRNAKAEMKTIKNALVQADPDNTAYYEENYADYAKKFDELDQKFTDQLSALPNKTIVVAHEAFGYLCSDYGLTQMGIEGLSADSEPDPARMAEIIRFARDNNVKTIFFEELVSPKTAEAIASEIGVKTDMLNPLEGLTEEQLAAGEDYLSVMEKNLETLVAALKE